MSPPLADLSPFERCLVPLSARDEAVLLQMVRDLAAFVDEAARGAAPDLLARIAYTLQVGREQMGVRLLIAAGSLDELCNELHRRASDGQLDARRHRNRAHASASVDAPANDQVEAALLRRDLDALGALWLDGCTVDWTRLHMGRALRRVNLPTYPFKMKRYWITEAALQAQPAGAPAFDIASDEGPPPPQPVEDTTAMQQTTPPLSEGYAAEPELGHAVAAAAPTLDGDAPAEAAAEVTLGVLQDQLAVGIAAALMMDADDIDLDVTFFELGVESLSGVEWIRALNARYSLNIKVSAIYDAPTLRLFSEYIYGLLLDNPVAMAAAATGVPLVINHDAIGGLDDEDGFDGPADFAVEDAPVSDPVLNALIAGVAEIRAMPAGCFHGEQSFGDLGLDLARTEQLIDLMNHRFGVAMTVLDSIECQSLSAFAQMLRDRMAAGAPPAATAPDVAPPAAEPSPPAAAPAEAAVEAPAPRPVASQPSGPPEPIAIIGMSGAFPMSPNLDAYWENLVAGRNCVSNTLPSERWGYPRLDSRVSADGTPAFYPHMGVLEEADLFDPAFFNVSPKEARLMDPQQRTFMQHTWQCIENAGYAPSSLAGTRCGVFAGASFAGYGGSGGVEASTHAMMGHSVAILPARIAYHLDLRGPSVTIDTACSSSLVSIAEACTNLAFGSCDMALAGGVQVFSSPQYSMYALEGGMLSADGQCHTFDRSANGFVPGEGVGVVLLKRLSDALRDGDQVLAVVSAWGVNCDGKTNGMTAPSVASQAELQRDVYNRFKIDPASISYVEAHGTGTMLGDPIEVQALTDSFSSFTDKSDFCALGSAKANIGHTLCASGVAGVLKILLSMKHKTLPPLAHFSELNEEISLAGSPFHINTRLTPWTVQDGARRIAAVSSFSYNGTNAHLVIEERVPAAAGLAAAPGGEQAIVLSAKNDDRLQAQARQLLSYVSDALRDSGRALSLRDLAYTLQVGRDEMAERLGFAAGSLEAVADKLRRYLAAPDAPGDDMFRANSRAGRRQLDKEDRAQAAERAATIARACETRDLGVLLPQWTHGANVDFRSLHAGSDPRRIDLPTYPMTLKRYWFTDIEAPAAAAPVAPAPTPSAPSPAPAPAPDLTGQFERFLERLQ